MPRKTATKEPKKDISPYISADGTLDISKKFKHQAKQMELWRLKVRDGIQYIVPAAPQCLAVGGIRSGKTSGWMMFLVMNYCMAWEKCDILILRRTFKELESGAIADFKAFVPEELYSYDSTKHVATLVNGSRVVFGHCQNNKERDIEQYLGQAYPGILVDECGQFSPDAWMMLRSRNTVNASCVPNKHGHMPLPCMVGCTNPLGPFYEYYNTVFVQKEPWQKPEDAKKDDNGYWWTFETGDWRLIYDPNEWAYNRTTVLDNPKLLERDPGIIARLNTFPKAKRDKMLLGLDGPVEGQYFDVWSEDYHVINLREDPEAIIWQPWQPVWASQDWGMGHANAAYLFTRADVKTLNGEYRTKVVCFKEIVTTGGKAHREWANLLAKSCKLPFSTPEYPTGYPVKLKAIYFSHEKFNRQMDGFGHTPADEYSRSLREVGLPPVTRGTQDRIGSASLMYNLLKNGELVILDTCKDIITAIPTLMRDPDLMDDVLKTSAKGDDCYDGFRLGLYGMLASKRQPREELLMAHAETLDPLAKHFYLMKLAAEQANRSTVFTQTKEPVWVSKLNNS
jgi:hypothetical protein